MPSARTNGGQTTGRSRHATPQTTVDSSRLCRLLDRTAGLYAAALTESSAQRQRLAELGLADQALLEHHRTGYCAGRLLSTLPSDGKLISELIELGVLVPGAPDDLPQEALLDHVTFPVEDMKGTLCGLLGEAPTIEADGCVAIPEDCPGCWNAVVAASCTELVLTASVLDALSLITAGLPNTVAAPYQAWERLTGELREAGVSAVTAIVSGTAASHDFSGHGPVRVRLAGSARPLAILAAEGPEALAAAAAAALRRASSARSVSVQSDGLDSLSVSFGTRTYCVLGLRRGANVLRATVRAEHAGRMHVDTLNLYRAGVRRVLVRDLAMTFDLPPERIEADIARLIIACECHSAQEHDDDEQPDPVKAMTPEDRREAEAFGRSPDLIERIGEDYRLCGLVGEEDGRLLCYLAAVSRKLSRPLSILILSSSGAGKSALQNTTLSLCPPEDVIKLTGLTGRALFYQQRTGLRHRVLAIEEAGGAEDAAYALRSLISEGELVISTTVRDRTTGGLTVTENRVEGPTAVFCTTTNPEVDPETRSRFFVLGVDESGAQTAEILALQRRREAVLPTPGRDGGDAIRRRHHTFQRLLRPLRVVNPLAPQLTYGSDRLQARRDQPKYLGLIRAVAFLRQMTKEAKTAQSPDGSPFEYIEADVRDVEIANRLAAAVLGQSLDELSRPARDLLKIIGEFTLRRWEELGLDGIPRDSVTFTRRQLREYSRWSNYRVHTYLNELLEMQHVVLVSGQGNSRHRYQLIDSAEEAERSRLAFGLRNAKELCRDTNGPDNRGDEQPNVRGAFGDLPDAQPSERESVQ